MSNITSILHNWLKIHLPTIKYMHKVHFQYVPLCVFLPSFHLHCAC